LSESVNPKNAEASVQDASDAGTRLDVFITERLGLFSRSQAKARIISVEVNGASARLSRRLKMGDRITLSYSDPPSSDLVPEDIPLAILFENDDVIVIDKPQGIVVHPGSGNRTGTLLNALLFHAAGMRDRFESADPRPGIVHRLDKETSGVIITAKNARSHEYLAAQFHDRTVRKRYLAVVRGRPAQDAGRIEAALARDPRNRKRFACVVSGGRASLTRYRVMRRFGQGADGYALILCAPKTGRTHQLRVHLRHVGLPILGDPLYGSRDTRFPDATLMLHARSLRIRLPGEAEPRTFVSPVPPRFQELLSRLQSFSPNKGL
jgi:23S rRNA pseudouridine1911/1915/1917 synthase